MAFYFGLNPKNNYSGVKSSRLSFMSSPSFNLPLFFRYSFVNSQNTSAMLFLPLLLHGTTKSTNVASLFVSQSAITGTPVSTASVTAFLSGTRDQL